MIVWGGDSWPSGDATILDLTWIRVPGAGYCRYGSTAGDEPDVLSSDTAMLVAVFTGAPNVRKRPPKAIAQMANHAQPKASPAMTSESQWTPSITRLHATATATAAAPPAMRARVRGARRRANTSATAA